ncbi:MAG: bifunctional 4-hydroxy-2-oxoglutarate aldolase/2-dehydro-3-deoxy-phosphogluconate aldolase [Pseudomonadota bacterium]
MVDTTTLRTRLRKARIVPVLTVERIEDAAPMAQALEAGGLQAIEVTLRTPVALDALKAMKEATPDLLVGAGTILSEGDVDAALLSGADFLVSPGASPTLISAMLDRDTISIPGVATATEAMTRFDEGFDILKLFPAAPVGGVSLLKSLAGPMPHLDFMPTGGIGLANAPDFLALPNVVAVGGSWLTPKDLVAVGDWSAITERAKAAVALG